MSDPTPETIKSNIRDAEIKAPETERTYRERAKIIRHGDKKLAEKIEKAADAIHDISKHIQERKS